MRRFVCFGVSCGSLMSASYMLGRPFRNLIAGPVIESPEHPLLFERVLRPHSPAQLGVSPSRPRRSGWTPRAASGHPCGVTRSIATGGFGVAAPQTHL